MSPEQPSEQATSTRIQLCGHFVVRITGERIEDRMPGRQGRLLFAFLAARPHRTATRDELVQALWQRDLPSAPDMALSALISKLRRLLGPGRLEGRSEIRLDLGRDALVDVQAARHAVHEAESLASAGRWWDAYPGAVIAGAIARRAFMRGEDAPWIDELRQEMGEVCVRAIECNVGICLATGGAELPTAAQLARELTQRAPFGRPGTACSCGRWSGLATSPRRFACTRAYGRDCARNSARRRPHRRKRSTGGYFAATPRWPMRRSTRHRKPDRR